MSKCPNPECGHDDTSHFRDADDEKRGSCWATPLCRCEWVPDDIREHELRALLAQREGELEALRARLNEAMDLLDDLAKQHDSYIGYLMAHNMYDEERVRPLGERLIALRVAVPSYTPPPDLFESMGLPEVKFPSAKEGRDE